ncbi:MAG: glycosyl transferase family protein [Parcubacteria group bacterium Gr01-1014_2]|nr:MAG: glycosyl transferase family protein [Parcubacteria group bacterium Gr01-1014_2]
MKSGLLATLIITTALALAISSFWNDSLIVDEIPHVGSGYSYVKALDYRLNPEHPPLAKALATFPLLFLDLSQKAFETKFWLQDINGQWDFGRFLIFQFKFYVSCSFDFHHRLRLCGLADLLCFYFKLSSRASKS